MEERLPCDKHEEQIKTLFKQYENIDSIRDLVYSLDKNMAVQTQLLQSVVDHNKKQDLIMVGQQEVISKINENLTELTEGQRILNSRVEKLEIKVTENENKNTIDIRDLQKEKYKDMFLKYILPTGSGVIILLKIFEIWMSK